MSAFRSAPLFVSSLAVALVAQSAAAQAQPAPEAQPAPAASSNAAPQASTPTATPQTPAPAQQTPVAPPAPVEEKATPMQEVSAVSAAPAPAPAPVQARPEPTFVGGFGTQSAKRVPKGSRLGLGVTLGFTSGLGLSLRRHFDSGLGLHFGGFGIWTQDVRHLNLATELLYSFYRGRWARVYGLAGVAWHANQEERGIQAPVVPGQDPAQTQTVRYEDYVSHDLIFGPGIGGELYLHPRFTMSLEVPLVFAIEEVGEKERALEDRLNIHPGVNASMHFYF